MPGLPRPMHPKRRTPLWKLSGNDLPASAAMGCGHGGCSSSGRDAGQKHPAERSAEPGRCQFRAAAGADADLPRSDAVCTLALLLQAMETCAVPIFAFLLVEGVEHTSSLRNCALRVAGLAVLSELPYNLATSGKLLDTTSRNPVFGLVVCLVMVYLYQKFPEKNAPHLLLRVLVTAAAVIWCSMLSIRYGNSTVAFSPRCGRSGAKAPSRALWARQCPSCAASSRCSSWLRRWAFWPFTFTTVKKARKTASSIIWRIRHCCWSSAQQGGFCSEPVPRFQS